MSRTQSFIRLSPEDNVVVALSRLSAGTVVEGTPLQMPVPQGHKVATKRIAAGEPVLKYGQVIGIATAEIPPGGHVHVTNLRPTSAEDPRRGVTAQTGLTGQGHGPQTFLGYRRADGRVGTRNFIGVMTSVNCAGTAARLIADAAQHEIDLAGTGIDGIAAFPHTTGCGMSDQGGGYELLRRTLAGYLTHPNFGGVLMVGLGCEQMQIRRLLDDSGLQPGKLLRFITIQDEGGTRMAVAAGLAALREMVPLVGGATREPMPLSALSVALQCGGSDAYSGITANPALGHAMDLLAAAGGTAILTETPEIFGAEHILAARARTPEVAARIYEKLDWWESYAAFFGNVLNNNPSPGNKAGGLTTIMEKSLGAVAKGGSSPLNQVVDYAERPQHSGLIFMDGPGFDPCSATGQIASGANVICFTTGRGSAFGAKPVPSIKLATSTALYRKMPEDMDINCGDVVEGGSIAAKGQEILERIIAVASGEITCSERLGYGGLEFVPWQLHAVL